MSEELYKKYRPKLFKDIVGQEDAVAQMKDWVAKEKVPHTVLFMGPSGCGKTTAARILAKKVKCEKADLREMNAASSRGIDDARRIEREMYGSAMVGESRVWIIDEAHKLTSEAQNALLKPLEDTPSHVYFFLCSSAPQKLIKAIQTRCTKLKFGKLPAEVLEKLVRKVCELEKEPVSDECVEMIVECAEGSAREALVILNQIIGLESEEARQEAIQKSLHTRQAYEIVRMLLKHKPDWAELSRFIREIEEDAEGIRRLVLNVADKTLLEGGKQSSRAFLIIEFFRDHYFDCGRAGLSASCWALVNRKD